MTIFVHRFRLTMYIFSIAFLTYLPNIFATVEQIGHQFCSDIAKCAKVHSKELLFFDGKKYNCIHVNLRIYNLRKPAGFPSPFSSIREQAVSFTSQNRFHYLPIGKGTTSILVKKLVKSSSKFKAASTLRLLNSRLI